MSPRLRLPVLLVLTACAYAGGWWQGKNAAVGPAQRSAQSATAQLPPPTDHPPGYLSSKAPPAAGAEAPATALAAWAARDPELVRWQNLICQTSHLRLNNVMVKTQVQIPDILYREAQRLAEENEMSFAEVVRRGLEQIIRHHPPGRKKAEDWVLPPPHDLGEALVPEEEWTPLCHDQA